MISTALIEKYLSLWPKRDVTTMSPEEFDATLEQALTENDRVNASHVQLSSPEANTK